jgi:hypothetical protein
MTELTDSPWPEPVAALQKFLKGAGLICMCCEIDPESGKRLQYGNAIIAVRLVFDRCTWLVEVAEMRFQSTEWYDAAILQDLLSGQSEDVLPLSRQIEIVKANWAAIVRTFGPMQIHDTRMRLAFLRLMRAKRRPAAPSGTPG